MIVKLCRAGGVELCLDANTVFQQPTDSGFIDVEIYVGANLIKRVLIGEDDGQYHLDGVWSRAYIMENGKTVDTIRQRRATT